MKITRESAQKSEDRFAPLPDGWYEVVLTEASEARNQKDTCTQFTMRCDVVGDKYAGRVIWDRFLTQHDTSGPAAEIGLKGLGRLALIIGDFDTSSPGNIIGQRFQVKLKTEARDGYEPKNTIAAFRASPGAMPADAPPIQAPVAKKTNPWD